MAMEFQVLAASAEDEPFLKELLRDVRADEFLPLHLPEAALAQLMDLQYRAQKQGYEQQFPNLETSVVWLGPYRVGRILVAENAESIRLVDIALLKAFRGNGIGGRLIEGLCERAQQAGLSLRLSVRQGNRAIELYTRIGFIRGRENGTDIEMEWGGLTPHPAVLEEEEPAESGPVEPGPTGAYFRTLRGTQAVFRPEHGDPIVLRLSRVAPLRPDPDANVLPGDSFALGFEGDSASTLGQGVYPLEFEDGYKLGIFLVPVSMANGVTTYESIFNRMHRLAGAT